MRKKGIDKFTRNDRIGVYGAYRQEDAPTESMRSFFQALPPKNIWKKPRPENILLRSPRQTTMPPLTSSFSSW
jgi:hypothetical protein